MGTPVRTVMVLGYGTMGRGVLASFAAHGFTTYIVSRKPDALKGLPEGTIAVGPDLPALELPPDLISEHFARSVQQASGLSCCLMRRGPCNVQSKTGRRT